MIASVVLPQLCNTKKKGTKEKRNIHAYPYAHQNSVLQDDKVTKGSMAGC